MKTITLPKSGLTLEPGEMRYDLYDEDFGTIASVVADERSGEWEAFVIGSFYYSGTFEVCCAFVDEQLVALRKALTPQP